MDAGCNGSKAISVRIRGERPACGPRRDSASRWGVTIGNKPCALREQCPVPVSCLSAAMRLESDCCIVSGESLSRSHKFDHTPATCMVRFGINNTLHELMYHTTVLPEAAKKLRCRSQATKHLELPEHDMAHHCHQQLQQPGVHDNSSHIVNNKHHDRYTKVIAA